MGRAALDGDFGTFQDKITRPRCGLRRSVGALSHLARRDVSFGWEGAFTRNGEAQPLAGFKHYDNPYCVVDLPASQLEVRYGDTAMRLNFTAV